MPAPDDGLRGEFRDAYAVLLARSPAAPAFEELAQADDAGPAGGTSYDAEHFDFRRNGDGPAPTPRRRLAPVALAAAATLLLVAGIVATRADRQDLRTSSDPAAEAVGSTPPSAQSGVAPDEWSLTAHGVAPFGDDDSVVSAVVAGGPGFVAVGASGGDAAVWTSIDGEEWSRRPHDETVFGGAAETSMADVTVGGPGLVAPRSRRAPRRRCSAPPCRPPPGRGHRR